MASNLDLSNVLFNNKKITIILDKNNNPWFKGKDIAKILDYSDTDQAIRIHVDNDEKKKQKHLKIIETRSLTNKEKNIIFINESGLYSLMMFSKKDDKIFRRWILKELLSSIRNYKRYKLEELQNELEYKKHYIISQNNF